MQENVCTINGKTVTLYPAMAANQPLIVLNSYDEDEAAAVAAALRTFKDADCNLLSVSGLNWNHDLTPWFCPPLSPRDAACTGGADDYLQVLLNGILPQAERMIAGTPPYIGIAGYSLAGLFAVYALYQTDVFDRAASISGSLWFPDFSAYCQSHSLKKRPKKLYFSLGDKEAKTRNDRLKTVQAQTEALVNDFRDAGIAATWELNPGNHFRDAALRSAKGIRSIL